MSRRTVALIVSFVLGLSLAGPVSAGDPGPGPERIADRMADRSELPLRGGRTPLGQGDTVAPGTIGVASSIGYIGGGFIAIVGEVWNRTTTRREYIEVEATLYNSSDVVIGTLTEVVYVERLAFGSRSPFVLFDEAPAGAEDGGYTVRVSGNGTQISTPPRGVYEYTVNPVEIDLGAGTQTYGGLIDNHTGYLTSAYVYVTTYDANGQVLDAGFDGPIGLAAQSSTSWSIELFYDPTLPVHHAVVSADGRDGSDPNIYLTSLDNYFDDVGNISFRDDILWLYEEGITTGCGVARFCPNADVARDQMASFIARAVGLTGTPTDYFTDDNGNTHELNINRIRAEGITTGCTATTYCPAGKVRRDQMASFLSRALDLLPDATDYFTDDEGNTHEANINSIRGAGITTGCSATTYCPNALVTRGQMAAFLHRAFD